MPENIYGKGVIAYLAKQYPQFYLPLGDTEGYIRTVSRGIVPERQDLSDFVTDAQDSIVYEMTPAGEVMVITLERRADFELFYRKMGCRCSSEPVAASMGASILDGVANWPRIRSHLEEYCRCERDAGREPDTFAEFKRFTSCKANYHDTVIVLSTGPYSGIKGETFGYDEAEWKDLSHRIRKAHECTHFLCRRKFSEQKDPVWDEIVADAVGILSAVGRYDKTMEAVFLGVNENSFTGGRLENYIRDQDLNETAKKAYRILERIEALCKENDGVKPFDLAVMLEERQNEWW